MSPTSVTAPLDDLYFRQIEIGPMANFVYLIGSRSVGEAVLVDPAWGVKELLEVAQADGIKVTGALITHGHPDHVGGNFRGQHIQGVREFLEQVPGKLYVHKDEVQHLPVPAAEAVPTDSATRLEIGPVSIEFIHTPGHTPGSQCFRVSLGAQPGCLVSGDTLFIGSCGRTDLPGSNPGDMYESLTQKLMKLDEQTLVFPGHNYTENMNHSTIGWERAHNAMVRFGSKTEFLAAMGYAPR